MKQSVTLDVELKDFLAKNSKSELLLMRKKNQWVCVDKEEFVKPLVEEIQKLKDEIETYRLDNQEMKHQIKNFKEALLQYGFNLTKGGDL